MAAVLQVHPIEIPEAAGFDDPLAALDSIAKGRGDYTLLHSGPAAGFSVLGWWPLVRLLIDAHGVARVNAPAGIELPKLPIDPLRALEQCTEHFSFESPHPLIGWLGFVSYDIGRHIEWLPSVATDDVRWPLVCFTLFRQYVIFDRAGGKTSAFCVSTGDVPQTTYAFPPQRARSEALPFVPGRLLEVPSPERYEDAVRRVREYIAAWDIYQANVSRRWGIRTLVAPHVLFRRLCEFSPATYSACMRINDSAEREPGGGVRHVLSASPELFLAVENGRAVTRPIKGTRPRDISDEGRDAALREALLDSAKDAAELTMIVDLLRNDLGRVSKFGTVRVTEPRVIEQHPTVWHTAATIASELREDAGLAEVLAALCPGGSITGAPKIRAMQIIEELEAHRRGLYCGNIGVIGAPNPAGGCPNLALNIAIRTIQMDGDMAYVHAGAGIVADSDPAQEYEETLHKAAAMLRTLGIDP